MLTLKNVLKINAISSGATGILLIVFPGFIAELFAASGTIAFSETGIFLVLFSVFVFYQSTKSVLSPKSIGLIISLDVLWVVISLIIIVLQLFSLSFLGYLFIALVAVWVAIMAILQFNGVKKLKSLKL
jgi:hypothetical protein